MVSSLELQGGMWTPYLYASTTHLHWEGGLLEISHRQWKKMPAITFHKELQRNF